MGAYVLFRLEKDFEFFLSFITDKKVPYIYVFQLYYFYPKHLYITQLSTNITIKEQIDEKHRGKFRISGQRDSIVFIGAAVVIMVIVSDDDVHIVIASIIVLQFVFLFVLRVFYGNLRMELLGN